MTKAARELRATPQLKFFKNPPLAIISTLFYLEKTLQRMQINYFYDI
jgi:hypothetical protein